MYVSFGPQKRPVRRNTSPLNLLGFETHIVEHCNLNCKACCHFSPLAKEEYLDTAVFEKDVKRIFELTPQLKYIRLLGGEPLLHPDITVFFDITRKYFPETKLELTSNGMLLPQMPDTFWENCRGNNVNMFISNYPIDIHFEKVQHWKEHGITINYKPDMLSAKNCFDLYPIDLNGGQDTVCNFNNCFFANTCVTLAKGRFYTCPIAASARAFKEYFHLDIYTGEENSIGIYEADNIQAILDFLCKPIVFCKYCAIKEQVFELKWGYSKKDIREWTLGSH